MNRIAKILVIVMPLACATAGDVVSRPTGAIRPLPEEYKAGLAGMRKYAPRTRLAGELPKAVDNSKTRWFPPIGDQGSLGSCAQWAEVYYAGTYEFARYNNLSGITVTFSPKWTYNWLNGGSDTGSGFTSGLQFIRDAGALTMSELPYDEDYRTIVTTVGRWLTASKRRFGAISYVANVNAENFGALKAILASGHVVTIATYVYSWKDSRVKDDPSTSEDDPYVNELVCASVSGRQGGHGMCIVGYNDEIWCDVNRDNVVSQDEKGAFKVANSWGTDYGNKGFVWLSYYAVRTPNPSMPSEGALWYNTAYFIEGGPVQELAMYWRFAIDVGAAACMYLQVGASPVSFQTPATTWRPFPFNAACGWRHFSGEFAIRADQFFIGDKQKYWFRVASGKGQYATTVYSAKLISALKPIEVGPVPFVVNGTTKDWVAVVDEGEITTK